jgi:hypothetical protein
MTRSKQRIEDPLDPIKAKIIQKLEDLANGISDITFSVKAINLSIDVAVFNLNVERRV